MEFESAIEGKMAKIAQLQRSLAVKDEVGRLQQQVCTTIPLLDDQTLS